MFRYTQGAKKLQKSLNIMSLFHQKVDGGSIHDPLLSDSPLLKPIHSENKMKQMTVDRNTLRIVPVNSAHLYFGLLCLRAYLPLMSHLIQKFNFLGYIGMYFTIKNFFW